MNAFRAGNTLAVLCVFVKGAGELPPTLGVPWPNCEVLPPLMGAPGMRRGAECVQGRVSGCAITASGWCPYAITSSSQPRALHAMQCLTKRYDRCYCACIVGLGWHAAEQSARIQSLPATKEFPPLMGCKVHPAPFAQYKEVMQLLQSTARDRAPLERLLVLGIQYGPLEIPGAYDG